MTTTTTYKFLDFVSFSGLYNWSVQYLNESKIQFNEKYPLVRIGDFLTRNKTAIVIQNDKEYKRATIKIRNGGIFLRDIQTGDKIGTKNNSFLQKDNFYSLKLMPVMVHSE